MHVPVWLLLSSPAVLLLTAGAQPRVHGDSARTLLRTSYGLTSADIARLDGGEVVARTLDASDKREVATLGVVRMRIAAEFYVDRLFDIANFKRDAAILQIGRFGDPPDLQNVASLTLEEADLRSLRDCRVGDCGVQLSAETIERFRGIDWKDGDAGRHANALMQRVLTDYVSAYRDDGASALMEYADRPEALSMEREFLSLTSSASVGWRQFPGLLRHLQEYPFRANPSIDDLMYWSKERVGRRGVVSVTHLAIARLPGGTAADYAIGTKQIYGSHYFDASLGLTVLVRDLTASTPVTYVVYLNRSRVDVLGGFFGGITRKVISSRARSTVSDQLARLQTTLEGRYAGADPR